MIIQIRKFINFISSLSPASSSTTSGFVSRGLFCLATGVFLLLMLIVLSSSPTTLYFDYDNNLENENVIYSKFYNELQQLDQEPNQKKIKLPLSMGRFFCSDNKNNDIQTTDATFDTNGASFGFVYSSTSELKLSATLVTTNSIFADFSAPLFANSPKELYPDGNASLLHQPHLFNAYILGVQSINQLPSQPDLPYFIDQGVINDDNNNKIFFKKMQFTTEQFQQTESEDGKLLATIKLFDAKSDILKKQRVPRIFLVWILKATEPNYNRREFNTNNVVRLHRFRLKLKTSTVATTSFKEEIIYMCPQPSSKTNNQLADPQHLQNQLTHPNENIRRIEFFGDSITAGMCNCEKGKSTKDGETGRSIYLDEDFSRSWPFLIGKKLGARVHTSAWSGIGLVRNARDKGTTLLKDIYKRACMTLPESVNYWKIESGVDDDGENKKLVRSLLNTPFIPQVVVINLGTNDFSNFSWAPWERNADFSEILTPAEYQETLAKEKIVEDSFVKEYIKMISYLSSTYGRILLQSSSSSSPLHFVLACGPMNTKMCDRILQKRILDVITMTKKNKSDEDNKKFSILGDEREQLLMMQKYLKIISKYQATFSLLKFDELPDELVECGTHPNDEGAKKMSKIGTAHLRKVLKWN